MAAPDKRWLAIEKAQGMTEAARIVAMLHETGGAADEGYVVRIAAGLPVRTA